MRLLEVGVLLVVVVIFLLFLGSFVGFIKGGKNGDLNSGRHFHLTPPFFGLASDKHLFYALLVVVVIVTLLHLILRKV